MREAATYIQSTFLDHFNTINVGFDLKRSNWVWEINGRKFSSNSSETCTFNEEGKHEEEKDIEKHVGCLGMEMKVWDSCCWVLRKLKFRTDEFEKMGGFKGGLVSDDSWKESAA